VHTTRTILAIALISALFLQEQTAKGPPTQSEKASTNPGFHWNWKDWQELSAEQSLRKAQLPNQQKKAIASAIADEIRPMTSDLEIQSEPELQKAALDTRVKMSTSNEFRDIVLARHGSYDSGDLVHYVYRKGFYHEAGCYDYYWSVLEGDKVRELKEPRITPCSERNK